MKTLISAVIPLYNKGATIGRTLSSILAQESPADEILVIDDGSTDDGGDRASAFSDPRVRVIRQVNAGESAARNRGISEAEGTLIAFLDADDTWEPHFLSEILELAKSHPDGVVYSTAIQVQQRDGTLDVTSPKTVQNLIRREGRLDYFAALAKWYFPLSSSSLAVPRKVFETCGQFDPTLAIGADIDMWVRLAATGPIYFSSRISATYFTDADNRSNERADFWDRRVEWVRIMDEKSSSLSLSDRELQCLRIFCSTLLYEAERAGALSDRGHRIISKYQRIFTMRHRILRAMHRGGGRSK